MNALRSRQEGYLDGTFIAGMILDEPGANGEVWQYANADQAFGAARATGRLIDATMDPEQYRLGLIDGFNDYRAGRPHAMPESLP